jgi:hypothetical protein
MYTTASLTACKEGRVAVGVTVRVAVGATVRVAVGVKVKEAVGVKVRVGEGTSVGLTVPASLVAAASTRLAYSSTAAFATSSGEGPQEDIITQARMVTTPARFIVSTTNTSYLHYTRAHRFSHRLPLVPNCKHLG